MRFARRRAPLIPVLVVLLAGVACARQRFMVEVSGTVMYEKPRILKVSHTIQDLRATGGPVSVRVTLQGDPGLRASFDITPDVADRLPMRETAPGTYSAEFALPETLFGGPYTVTGRLEHPDAGEATQADPDAIAVGLLEPTPSETP